MHARLAIAALAVAALVPLAAPAQVRAGIGGDYVFDGDGIFELTLSVEGRLARRVAVEGRFGGLVVTNSSPTLGVPLDFGLRLTPGGRAYVEALVATFIAAGNVEAVSGNKAVATTLLPGVLVGRYLGDSGEEAMEAFTQLWKTVRPAIAGREAVEPRIWST